MKKTNIVYTLVFILNILYIIVSIKYGYGILNSREKIYISAHNLSGHNSNIKSKAFDMLIEDYEKSILIDDFIMKINIAVTAITIFGLSILLFSGNQYLKKESETKK